MTSRAESLILMCRNLTHIYRENQLQTSVLRSINLEIRKGETVALVGPSGSGKSTLLHMLGLLDTPTTGEIWIGGQSCAYLKERERTLLRRHKIGFVYQFHHLLPEFTALENVILPQRVAGVSWKIAMERAQQLLTDVGLAHRLAHRPSELSGGERQRVSLVRSLANSPQFLLADEPTGSLDEDTGAEVFHLLKTLVNKHALTLLMATHNIKLLGYMDRVLRLSGGHLEPFPLHSFHKSEKKSS